jgi:hypothetical protein
MKAYIVYPLLHSYLQITYTLPSPQRQICKNIILYLFLFCGVWGGVFFRFVVFLGNYSICFHNILTLNYKDSVLTLIISIQMSILVTLHVNHHGFSFCFYQKTQFLKKTVTMETGHMLPTEMLVFVCVAGVMYYSEFYIMYPNFVLLYAA